MNSNVYGYLAEGHLPEIIDQSSYKTVAEERYAKWARGAGKNPIAQIHWFNDSHDDRRMPLFTRPGGSLLSDQIEPGDILLLANQFPYASPFNIPEVFSFVISRRITAIHTPSGTVLEPDTLAEFMPTLESLVEHVALQLDAMIDPPDEEILYE